MEPGIEKQNREHQNHRKQEQHWKRNQTPPKEEQPPEAINLSQNEPMKNQIRENPIDLETKEGNSQMKCEKQPKENQDEMKLHQLDWKAKPEMETVVEEFSETEEEAANDKTERGAFSTAEN